jgi:hypothetical protein
MIKEDWVWSWLTIMFQVDIYEALETFPSDLILILLDIRKDSGNWFEPNSTNKRDESCIWIHLYSRFQMKSNPDNLSKNMWYSRGLSSIKIYEEITCQKSHLHKSIKILERCLEALSQTDSFCFKTLLKNLTEKEIQINKLWNFFIFQRLKKIWYSFQKEDIRCQFQNNYWNAARL